MYMLGKKSEKELVGVHPDLVKVVKRAIQITKQDFSVHDGIRTRAEQARYVASGVSKTMSSKHLPQKDGFGHAVDLVPYINKQLRWEWVPIYVITLAVQQAAKELGVELIWGGVWDRKLSQLPTTTEGLRKAVEAYAARHPGPDFLDGPHFQLA